MFYIPPATRVILPFTGISFQPFYLLLLEGKLPLFFLLPKPLSTVPSSKKFLASRNYFQRANKASAGTPHGRLPWDGRMWQMQRLHCLGKCSPSLQLGSTLRQHSTPSSFPKVSVRKPFFVSSSSFFFSFCSYQFKQEQWIPQALQECDKVSTKPTRKVMYGPWSAAPINHFTNPSCKEWALQPRAQNASFLHPQTCTLHTHHPPAPLLDGTCHPSNKLACSRVKFFSFRQFL